jgi:hypothetical protein
MLSLPFSVSLYVNLSPRFAFHKFALSRLDALSSSFSLSPPKHESNTRAMRAEAEAEAKAKAL